MKNIRNITWIIALALVVAYSIIATTSNGELTAIASPLLIAAIALVVWHDRTESVS